jgi:hypothetical protein
VSLELAPPPRWRAARPVCQGKSRLVAATLAVALFGGGCTGDPPPVRDAPVRGGFVRGASSGARLGLVVPASYEQACAYADGMCMPGDEGPIPDELKRPLHFPEIGASGRCPTSVGHRTTTPFATGELLGRGSVEPLVTNSVTRGATATLGSSPDSPRWRVLKVIWMSLPSYLGPVVVRGTRLDRRGLLAFGTSPSPGPLVVPPGPSMNGYGGYRIWPDTAWVRHPGCYAWQVDGLTFSETIVFKAVLPGPLHH